MVRRVLQILNREYDGLHKAALVLAVSSVGSSILALFRDRLLAGTFGAGKELDIYYAAFRIPDFLYVTSITIVSATVLIPSLLDHLRKSEGEAKKFLNSVFTVFLGTMLVLIVITFFLIPLLAHPLAPGFTPQEREKLVTLARILLFSPFFLGISSYLSSIVQSFRRFFVYALSPIFYNVGIVIGIVFFYPAVGLEGIAFGVAVGSFLHMLIQVPSIIRLGFLPRLISSIQFTEVRNIVKLSFPRSLGLGVNQLVLSFITALASLLTPGSIAVFNLSYNLQSVSLSVIGVSFAVAAFPTLSKLFVEAKHKEFLAQIARTMRSIVFWTLPTVVLFIVLRAQIVRVIFGYKNFSWTDTRLTAAELAIFSLSLLAQALIIFFTRAYYAAGKTAKPIGINVFSSLVIILVSIFSIKLFHVGGFFRNVLESALRVQGVPGTDMLLLPLAFSFGMILNALLLYRAFTKDFPMLKGRTSKPFYQTVISSILMGFVAYFSLNFLDKVFDLETFLGIFLQGFMAGSIGLSAWFIILYKAKSEELMEIILAVKEKFWRAPVVISEPTELP